MRDLAGKGAFVTGGVSGIGFALTQALAAAGMRVVATYRSDAHVEQARALIDAHPEWDVHLIYADVADRQSVAAAAEETQRLLGAIHVLCNNAGVNLMGPMDQATFEDWDWLLGVNLQGVINVLVTFLPRLKAHGEGGHVLNVASMSSFIVGPKSGLYATSKFAVRGLTESLRFSLAPHRIGVSLLCPGLTQSRIYEAPLRRPPHLARTAFEIEPGAISRLEAIHAVGMDAHEVARKAVGAILENRFYVFSHAEFREEVRELADEVDRSFPEEPCDPARMQFEAIRRRALAEAREVEAALGLRPPAERCPKVR